MALAAVPDEILFTELDASPKQAPANGLQIPARVQEAVKALNAIGEEMKEFYVGQSHHEAIDDMLLALVTAEHLVMLGDPGNGKSDMASELMSRVVENDGSPAASFHILLSKATDPSEVVGGINIPEMQRTGRYERMTEGMLPEAFLGFLDECFKANSVVLNFLLGILNEREFTNAGRTIRVPLHTCFLASNEGPESEELEAFYDRILFRHRIAKPEDLDQRKAILLNIYRKKNGQWRWRHGRVTVNRYALAETAEFVNQIRIPDAIFESLKELDGQLEKMGRKDITVRRMGKALRVLQGHALLHGRTTVGRSDFKALLHVLADNPQDVEELRQVIDSLAAGPWLSKMQKYLKDAQEKRDNYLAMPDTTPDQRKAKSRASLAVKTELVKILRSANNVIKDAQAHGEDIEELKAIKQEITRINADVVDHINNLIGAVSPIDSLNDEDLF